MDGKPVIESLSHQFDILLCVQVHTRDVLRKHNLSVKKKRAAGLMLNHTAFAEGLVRGELALVRALKRAVDDAHAVLCTDRNTALEILQEYSSTTAAGGWRAFVPYAISYMNAQIAPIFHSRPKARGR